MSVEKKIVTLQSRRDRIVSRIRITHELLENLCDENKKEIFLARCEKLPEWVLEFEQLQNDLEECLLSSDKPKDLAELSHMANTVDSLYFEVMKVKNKVNNLKNLEKTTLKPTEGYNIVRAPRIELPTFDSNIKNWNAFYSLFKSLIHDNAFYTNVEKFHYLLSSVTGHAASQFKSLPIISENYEIAWNSLVGQFQNSRMLFTHYVDGLLTFKNLQTESALGLSRLLNTFQENSAALKCMNIDNLLDKFIAHMMIRNMDAITKRNFESGLSMEDIPSSEMIFKYLRNQARTLEMTTSHVAKEGKMAYKALLTSNRNHSLRCPLCNGSHFIYKCESFNVLNASKRRDKIKELNLCFNCFKSHRVQDCDSKFTCRICKKKHHSMLHVEASNSTVSNALSGDNNFATSHAALAATNIRSNLVLLGTAQVLARNQHGRYVTIRVVIDSGSQISIITQDCAKRLGLIIKNYNIPLSGLGNSNVKNCQGITKCVIKPQQSEGPIIKFNTVVISKITSNLPSCDLSPDIVSKFHQCKLADKHYYKAGNVDVLLGADVYMDIFKGCHETIHGNPGAIRSIFGFIIMGKIDQSSIQTPITLFTETSETSLNDVVKQFWEIEETPSKATLSKEDESAEDEYSSKHYREPNGRYVVPLLVNQKTVPYNNSVQLAESRLKKLEYRFSKNTELAKCYGQFLKEYESLDHMEKVPRNVESFYLPHHCVINPHSKTTRVRVVFDGSIQTQPHNISLNNMLLSGPKLQTEIPRMILNFRFFKYVFTADICKMYRQILIIPSERKFQHILWRDAPTDPISEFELKTITYGLSSSPFLAIRTLRQLARDEGSNYSIAAKALEEDFYVDDVMTGSDTIEDARSLKHDLIELLHRGRLELSKWQSNTPSLLTGVLQEHSQAPYSIDNAKTDGIVKLLGIQWLPTADHFTYNINFPANEICTKRTILSMVARLFDPMGWISPVTFLAKCLLQELWKLNINWDDEVPPHIRNKWETFSNQLPSLNMLKIPRHYNTLTSSHLNLVGFCDASQLGYAAVLYLVNRDNNSVHLLMGKSKVAPLKTLSIPRLELCGALLLTKLVNYILTSVKFRKQIENVFLFTDSTIVLAWLQTPPYLLKTFVANRVTQIIDNVPLALWKHVSSDQNCADCASRGIFPQDIISHQLWFSGPSWLRQPAASWPCAAALQPPLENLPETKTAGPKILITEIAQSAIFNKYSSFHKMKRIIAWVMRFINQCRKHCSQITGVDVPNQKYLVSHELNSAFQKIVKIEQNANFATEIRKIKKGEPCSPYMQRLKPFIDSNGIVRVGGRLTHSNLPYEAKFPILLPKQSNLTNALIEYYHRVYLHVGPRSLQSILQRKFWIISLRNKVRSLLSKCLVCHKFKASAITPIMGELPPSRVQQSRAFSRVGTDFGGPFIIKNHNRRGAKTSKAYLCLFICMATKAVHLELVTDLSSEAFIAALTRFVARRGLCSELISDNGTNYVGAKRHLNEIQNYLAKGSHQQAIHDHLASQGIVWKFNPPSSPHFGGLFEAGIKSSKYHIKRVIGDTILTYEEFSTLLTKIEAILNSRPLCPLSADPEDIQALTPGHFLIGDILLGLPEYDFEETASNRLSRWQHLQKMSQHFWRRWHNEYLNTLQQRLKWYKTNPDPKVGQLVLIKDERYPPMKWRLGRIMEVHPGQDGVVRVVTIKTSNGTLVRPTIKLCPLPVD